MDPALVSEHVRAIDACNQRGGRMLTLVDLIDASTVDLPLAAYLATMMRAGASLLVGANPGGAGKTTIMCALLNFLPDHTTICPVENLASLRVKPGDPNPGATCFLAHEIGSGPYYAYIWDQTARAFFRLAAQGHVVASNLHTDTLAETRDQLCRQNGVEEAHLGAIALKVYLGTARGDGWDTHRWVSQVHEGEALVWAGEPNGTFTRLAPSAVVSAKEEEESSEFLRHLLERDIRTIPEVRTALTTRTRRSPPP